MIYGESPAEFSGKDTYDKFKDLEVDHFLKKDLQKSIIKVHGKRNF